MRGLALLAIIAIALSGCSGSTPEGTTTSATTTDTATAAPAGQVRDYECTASTGGVVGGGVSGVIVAGCTMSPLSAEGKVVSMDVPSGCRVDWDDNGDNLTEPVQEGETYPRGAVFQLGCDATNTSGTATVGVQETGA